MSDWNDVKGKAPWAVKGFGWRVTATILLGVLWFCFLIIWLFFYAGNWDFYQNIAIIVVSIILVIGALAAMWASWGMRYAKQTEGEEVVKMQTRRFFGVRAAVSTVMWIGWLIFILIWLFAYAGNYNIYQNIAIFIVSIVIVGGLNGVLWGTLWRHYRW